MTLAKALGSVAILSLLGLAGACGVETDDDTGAHEANVFEMPAEGSCDAMAMLAVVNDLDFEMLDVDVALDRRAAENIVAEQPIDSLAELDAIAYVGPSALEKILSFAKAGGFTDVCEMPVEIGIISDLDKTVIPPGEPDLSEAPYPGVSTLYQILEHRDGGVAGDMYYVTARTPESVTEIPMYLEDHRVPVGPIETGVSGLPWVAEPEKVADVERILAANPGQRFILLGDSSHRDPEVYKTILANHPDRIVAGFIHKVNKTVSEHRVEGLVLHEGYALVAATLYGLGELTRDEALSVMLAAQEEGADLSDEAIQALLDAHAPQE